MAWIELHQSVVTHRKTLALADVLDIRPVEALGHMASLWLWLLDNAPNGCIAGITDRALARAAQWDEDPAVFRAALVEAELVHEDGAVHDWDDYAGKLIDRRKQNAERMKEARQKARAHTPSINKEERATHVQRTSTARAPATEQNSTVPNHTSTAHAVDSTPDADAPDVSPPAETPEVKAIPKPNKYSDFIDAVKAAGIDYASSPKDAKALKSTPLSAEQVAEVYVALALKYWGDEWQWDHLSAATAAGAWNAYVNAKRQPRTARLPNSHRKRDVFTDWAEEARLLEAQREQQGYEQSTEGNVIITNPGERHARPGDLHSRVWDARGVLSDPFRLP